MTLIVIWTKFAEGAWLVIVAIPLLVAAFLGINRHYRRFGRRLRAGVGAVRAARSADERGAPAVDAIDVATEGALWYARQIAPHGHDAGAAPPGPPHGLRHPRALVRLRRANRGSSCCRRTRAGAPLLEEVWRLPRGESDFVTVVVPEQFKRASLLSAAAATSFRLKLRLLSEPGVVVTDVPAVTRPPRPGGPDAERLLSGCWSRTCTPARCAPSPTRSPSASRTRGPSRSPSTPRRRRRFARGGRAPGSDLPLDLSDAPYRDIGTPLLAYLRELTADPDTVVNVVMPEIVVRGRARILHNQRALYIKRLLLFEPHVILSSVPYQLFR